MIGELEDSFFIDPLLQRGWIEQDPEVQQALLHSLKQIVPADKHPELSSQATYQQAISHWSRWNEKS